MSNDLRCGRHVVYNLHVHLLVVYPPKVAICSLVNSLKGASSRLLRMKEYPSIIGQLWGIRCGRLAILQVVVVVLQLKSSASTLNSKIVPSSTEKHGNLSLRISL